MSESARDEPGPIDGLVVERAEHLDDPEVVNPQFDEAVALLRELAAQPDAPAWVSQVTNGLEDVQVYAVALQDADRASLTACARLLSLHTDELDDLLEEARTGRLIRVVVQTESLDVYCLSVVPGTYVVGAQPGRATDRPYLPVETTDELLANHVQQRRELLGGLPDRNAGGHAFGETNPSERVPAVHPVEGVPREHVEAILRDAFRPPSDNDVLHWLALAGGREPEVVLDEFDAPDVMSRFPLAAPDNRRKIYKELAQGLPGVLSGLAHAVWDVFESSYPRSIVLDVESGVIVVHPLVAAEGDPRYLIGVTLHQGRVQQCQNVMSALAEAVAQQLRSPVGAGSRSR